MLCNCIYVLCTLHALYVQVVGFLIIGRKEGRWSDFLRLNVDK
jgi:hypothetical protein